MRDSPTHVTRVTGLCHPVRVSVSSLLNREVYLYSEVDRFVGLRSGTARRWINGYRRGQRSYAPILRDEVRDTEWATWGEFVETRILAEYREQEIPTVRLRGAVQVLRERFQVSYPLAHIQPYLEADAGELVIAAKHLGLSGEDERLVVRTGQLLLSEPSRSLINRARISYEADSKVVAELPIDSDFPEIVINPDRSSGQPTVVGRRVSVATLAGMVASGEDRADVAADYNLSLAQVDAAVRYAQRYGIAA